MRRNSITNECTDQRRRRNKINHTAKIQRIEIPQRKNLFGRRIDIGKNGNNASNDRLSKEKSSMGGNKDDGITW